MYFPSSSWYKFVSQEDEDRLTPKNIEEFTRRFEDHLVRSHELDGEATAVARIFADNLIEKKTDELKEFWTESPLAHNQQITLYKQILEECFMPIYSKERDEMDYIDTSKLHELIVKPTRLFDQTNQVPLHVNYEITLKSDEELLLIAYHHNSELRAEVDFPLASLEHILKECAEQVVLMDEHKGFQQLKRMANEDFITAASCEANKKLVQIDCKYEDNNGIGLIFKADNSIVATFESLNYHIRHKSDVSIEIQLEHLIGDKSDIHEIHSDPKEYTYKFYDLSSKQVKVITQYPSFNLMESKGKNLSFKVSKFDFEPFEESDPYFSIIQQAQKDKALLPEQEDGTFITDDQYQTFMNSRLAIMQESKEKEKKKKVVNQFADIDLF